MVDQSHLDILQQGVDAWNSWRERNPSIQPDLSDANLMQANLSGADLSFANLRGANLIGAYLVGANLIGAYLSQANSSYANLSKATLISVNFFSAALIGAELTGANLVDANLSEANLLGARFNGALLIGANLVGANLIGAYLLGAKLNGAYLSAANLSGANFTQADLSNANLRGSILAQTILKGAALTGCTIYGISAWSLELEGAIQKDLNISPENEPVVTVDDLQVAQFVYLLLNNEKIRDVIDTIGEKGVLILGRFTEERKPVLDAIRDRLRELGFVPMMFDFERPSQQDFDETIKTLAGLSRFVIADITNPKSSPLELQAIMPNYMIPFIPIIQEDEEPFAMFQGLQHKYGEWVLDVLEYDSVSNLLEVLDDAVVRPALVKADQLMPKKTEAIRKRHVKDYQ